MDDATWLAEAVALSREALADDRGGPFGAVVVRDGVALARARNLVLERCDPTAHAEVLAIREACAAAGSPHLDGAVLYASCEPCPMCAGAIRWARIARVVYAATRTEAARAGFDDLRFHEEGGRPAAGALVREERRPLPEAEAVLSAWARRPGRALY